MRCIIYDGYIGKNGYGFDYNPETKKTILAHRYAFKLANGYLPKVVMHTCDNPSCVNPEHLIAGTQSDNIKDCYAKGRAVNNGKLNKDQVLAILKDSRSCAKIAKDYNVDSSTISNLKKGKFYKRFLKCGS